MVTKGGRSVEAKLCARLEDQRRQTARSLHRDVAPGLSAAILELSLLQREPAAALASAAPEALDRVLGVLHGCVERLRALELSLRPPLLEEAGLAAPLRWLAQQEQVAAALPDRLPRLDRELEWRLYQSVDLLVRAGLRGPRQLRVDAGGPARAVILHLSGTPTRELPFALAAARSRLLGRARLIATGARTRRFALDIQIRVRAGRASESRTTAES